MSSIARTSLLLSLSVTTVGFGCASQMTHGSSMRSEAVASSSEAPSWVLRTPSVEKKVCAVAAVDPTFFRDDARQLASDAVRNELARTVQVRVSSVMYDEQRSDGGGWVDQAAVQHVVGSISDVVLAGSQVMEIWFDELGSVSGEGMTYALACMPTDKSIEQLAAKLESIAPVDAPDRATRIERVKQNAKKAFEYLESHEG